MGMCGSVAQIEDPAVSPGSGSFPFGNEFYNVSAAGKKLEYGVGLSGIVGRKSQAPSVHIIQKSYHR